MATHSSIVAWEIPGTEEPGGLQPLELQGVGHALATERGITSHITDPQKLLYNVALQELPSWILGAALPAGARDP